MCLAIVLFQTGDRLCLLPSRFSDGRSARIAYSTLLSNHFGSTVRIFVFSIRIVCVPLAISMDVSGNLWSVWTGTSVLIISSPQRYLCLTHIVCLTCVDSLLSQCVRIAYELTTYCLYSLHRGSIWIDPSRMPVSPHIYWERVLLVEFEIPDSVGGVMFFGNEDKANDHTQYFT